MIESLKAEGTPMEEGFPPSTLHTLYCDGISNLAPNPHVMKFYLFRADPDMLGKPGYKNQTIAQVVMPISAFIQTSLFFDRALKQFTEQGVIPQQLVNEIKRTADVALQQT
jgi:hypothetical protein